MYNIIKLDTKQEEIINLINDQTDLYCVSLKVINRLSTYANYPISNKRIALNNILKFLRYLDTQLKANNSKSNILPLSWKIFESYFSRKNYHRYVEILHELDILSTVNYSDGTYYKIGKANQQYKLHANVAFADDVCLLIFDNDSKKPIFEKDNNDYNDKFTNTIKNIKIDYRNAITAELDHFKLTQDIEALRQRLNTIFSLAHKRFIKAGTKSKRVYHSLSNISRVSRPYLRLNDTHFHDLDIVNCQPLLLCYLLKKRGMNIDSEYIHDCTGGIFYERFVNENINRDKVKVELYKCIFFDFKTKAEINKQFKKIYPDTWASLQSINKEKETLASQLQNVEADIFNQIVPINSEGYFSLFDAIYFTDITDANNIAEYIVTRFKEYGLEVSIKLNGVLFNVVTKAEIIAATTKVIFEDNKEQLKQYMLKTKDPITNTTLNKIASELAANNIRISYRQEVNQDEFWGKETVGYFDLVSDDGVVSLTTKDIFPFEENTQKILQESLVGL